MGWVIKNTVAGRDEYYGIAETGGGKWTPHIDEALQFAREEDARRFDGGARVYLEYDDRKAFVPGKAVPVLTVGSALLMSGDFTK